MNDSNNTYQRAHRKYKRIATDPDRIDDLHELVDFDNENDPRIADLQKHGLTVHSNVLSEELQRELAWRALTQYCEPPHMTNLRNLGELTENLFYTTDFDKMAWSTMGYHYDWTARKYPQDQGSPVPRLLINLGRYFVKRPYTPKAVIVNYYTTSRQMGGHRDDLEYALTKPIVSLSLGRPCVFLLGGATKEDPVTPLLLRRGDVMIMDGKSRMYYHGMARLLPDIVNDRRREYGTPLTLEDLHEESSPNREDKLVHTYLQDHRLNMNLRQVYDEDTE